MSVALATMEAAYGLGSLGLTRQLHQPHLQLRRDERREELQEPSLRFSVVNILRPEFGREAILNTRASPRKVAPIRVTALPPQSPLGLPRDLSLSSSRLSPHSPVPASGGLGSPVQRHSSSLSRSGSLESLASSRSSVAGSSIAGAPSVSSATSSAESLGSDSSSSSSTAAGAANGQSLWPAWIYCTRYSDRPSSGPRTRRVKRPPSERGFLQKKPEDKRPRTAFSAEQLAKLQLEFTENRYLNETRRQKLSKELGLNEQQIKIWFQNKRAKIKKASGQKNPLALQLMAQGLYNHSTVPVDEDGEEIPE